MSFKINKIFDNLICKKTTHTSAQTGSSTSGTYTTIAGSEIAYAPASGSTKVVYEINYYAERKSGLTLQAVKLEKEDGGSWSEINAKYLKNFGNSGSGAQSHRWCIHLRFVVPSWSGSTNLRLVTTGAHSGHGNISMHQLTDWDGSSATDQFCNTNLIVYSI